MESNLFINIKMYMALLLYFGLVYPIKFIISPILKILYENIYILVAAFFMWVLFIDMGSINNITTTLAKNITANYQQYIWLISPIIIIFGIEITPIHIFVLIGFMILAYKIFMVIKELWGYIKQNIGTMGMIALWLAYTITGDRQKVMMCIKSGNEKKTVFVFILGSIILCCLFCVYVYLRIKGGL